LERQSAESMAQAQQLIGLLEPLATKLTIFTFFVIPLVVLLLWCVFHALHYFVINKKSISFWYYLRFFIFTTPFFVVVLLLTNKAIGLLYENIAAIKSWKLYSLIFAVVFLGYLLQILYSFVFEKSYLAVLQKAAVAIKKIYVLFPLYFVYFIIYALVLVIALSDFVLFLSKDFVGILSSFASLFVLLLLLGFYRTFFTMFAQKVYK